MNQSNLQTSRWLSLDLWGLILDSNKSILPLFKAVYRPFGRRYDNSVLRIDITKPRKIKKKLSRYAQVVLERRKLAAFYDISHRKFLHLARRERVLSNDAFGNFVAHLESLSHIVAWRTGFFLNPTQAKNFTRGAKLIVNNKRVPSPGFRIQPGDFCDFSEYANWGNIPYKMFQRIWRFRNNHLMFNFKTLHVLYCQHPDIRLLFNYVPIKFQKLFFTTRYKYK